VVETDSLENYYRETYRGFESHLLRSEPKKKRPQKRSFLF
jgi:hypothetical protein